MSGIVLFNVVFDEPGENKGKTVQIAAEKESLPHTDKKIENSVQEEKGSETVVANNKKQVQMPKEETEPNNRAEKLTRKLLGGADVYFIEPKETKE